MIEYILIGICIGSIGTFACLTLKLHQFGWSWGMLIRKSVDDKQ